MKSQVGQSIINQSKQKVADLVSGATHPRGAEIDKEISDMKSSLQGMSLKGLDRFVEKLNEENQQMEKVSAGVDLVEFVKTQQANTEEYLQKIDSQDTELINFAKVSMLMYQMFLRQDEMIDITIEIAKSVLDQIQEIYNAEDQDENFATLEESNSKEVVKEALELMQATNQEKAPEEKISLEEAIKQVIAKKGAGQQTREEELPTTQNSQINKPNAGIHKFLENKKNK